jgi:hypothetical protein
MSNSQAMKLKALDVVRANRAVRPNVGFLKRLEVLQIKLAGRSCIGVTRGRAL